MSDGSDRSSAAHGTGEAAREAAKQERLAQALRANLKRRKDQMRGRAAEPPSAPPPRDDAT